MNPAASSTDPALISRRAALHRAAALLGFALSPSLVQGVLRAQPAAGEIGRASCRERVSRCV